MEGLQQRVGPGILGDSGEDKQGEDMESWILQMADGFRGRSGKDA